MIGIHLLRSFGLGLALLGGSAHAQPAAVPAPSVEFQQLGSVRNFQSDVVTEVMRDRIGFLWIGTREGLFLYDGQRFRKFEHNLQDDASLSSNGVRTMLEDAQGRLWVATITGGLNLLDRAHWRFRHWRTGNGDRSPSHDGVFALAEAGGGRLWVGTQAGLDLFDPQAGRFRPTALDEGGEFVMALLRDRRGQVWVGTLGEGLFLSKDGGRSFRRVGDENGGTAVPKDVFALAEDARGQVWVGTRAGLFVAGEGGLRAPRLQPAALADALLNVTEIEPLSDGGLWVGTFGVGLYRIDAAQKRLEEVPLGVKGPPGRHVDQGALALDANGGLLVGTFGAGLWRAGTPPLSVQSWTEQSPEAHRLPTEDVYAVQPDGAGGAWVGTFGDGVQHLLPDGRMQPVALPEQAPAGLIDGVIDLLQMPDGTLWAATSGGVYRFNSGTGAFRLYRHPDPATAYSVALLRDRAARLWVGTGGGGLLLYRPASDDFRQFLPGKDPHSLPGDFVTVLRQDRGGRLWVGTRSNGVGICTLRQARLACERITARADGPAPTLSHYHVTDLFEASDDLMLVGTAGGGLDRLHLDAAGKAVDVARLSRADGLMDDNVMALAPAPDGALWVATRSGFSRLAGGEIRNFGPNDGLPNTVFNQKAVAAIDKRLYWGTQQGLVAVDPRVPVVRKIAPPTVIASIEGLPDELQPDVPAWQAQSLRVPQGQPFSLEFAVLGYSGGDPEYQYRLRPNESWIGLDERGQLTLHALAPGDYDLQVRGRRAGSAWTSAAPLRLSIVPPWWRRPAVQGAAWLALVLALVAGFAWRTRALQRRNRELQAIQLQREDALEAARVSRGQLEDAFARLRGLTMRLEAAKEAERKHLARELHDEFGQALTAAKINLRLALTDASAPGTESRIADTVQLVDGLISQVRALSFDLRPPLLDEMGLAPALEGYLGATSQRSGVPVRVRIDPGLPALGTEREIMLFRIVQEAVTNALRHAGARSLDVSLQRAGGDIAVEVRDDGRGFDLDAVNAGHGLGLPGIRERVHELGGELALHTSPGGGTRLSAIIPLGEGHGPGREDEHARSAG